MSKRSLFSPLYTSWMLLWSLLLVFTYQGRVRRYCSEPPLAFPRREVSKAAQKGQAVPEIPLSISSKLELELLGAFVVAKFPYPVHSLICLCMHIAVYTCIRVY